jgi:hypothetical protein
LPKWIEAESSDEIRPAFSTVSPGAEPRDEPCSHVQPDRNCEAVRGMDGAASREETIEPNFALELLLHRLGTTGSRQRRGEPHGNQHHRFLQTH